jgi:cytoskeletal protein CcmA (bactofilin family)
MAKKEDRNPMPDKTAGKEPGLSVVAAGMRVTGQLDTNGVVKVEGVVSGSVRAERQVLVAKGGVVEGDILTVEAVIGGEVRGAIYADERVEVQASSLINGDITTKRILLQEGGEVNGHLKMEDPKALSRKPSGLVPGGSATAEETERAAETDEPADEEPEPGKAWRPPVGHGAPNP